MSPPRWKKPKGGGVEHLVVPGADTAICGHQSKGGWGPAGDPWRPPCFDCATEPAQTPARLVEG